MSYSLRLGEPVKITDLKFPDITKLEPIDRDYGLVRKGRHERSSDSFTPDELGLLELRSKFYEDLGVQSIDEHFLGGARDRHGYVRRPDTLAGKGAVKVLHAIRTFTTDTDLINYRLDVQDDLEQNPNLIPAMQRFYTEIMEAKAIHFGAYARDQYKKRIRDQWGRYVFRQWGDLPASFAKLDKAIDDFEQVLSESSGEAMQEISAFFRKVREHPIYQGWTQHAGKVYDGGRYFVAIDYEPADGARIAIQLGPVVADSAIDKLVRAPSNPDGTIDHNLGDSLQAKRLTGLVRAEFGHMVQELTGLNFDSLDHFCDVLISGMEEQFSFYAALGEMYKKWEEIGLSVTRPIFGEAEGIEIEGTVHPTIANIAMNKQGRYTTNDYVANSVSNAILVTGPNDGGKTASAKGIGLDIALAQAGMRVPAKSFKMQVPRAEIYTHFILKEEVQDGSGRHKNELLRARRLCEVITPQDFLLYDEPCGGTDVKSGLVDSTNLLEYAWQIGLPFIFATHIHELAETVEEGTYPGVRNMQAEILEIGGELTPTHRIIPGRAKESYGSRVSREVGVTRDALRELFEQRVARGELTRIRT